MSIKIGLNPIQIIELISELQVKGGTIISPPSGYFSLSNAKQSKLADEPLLTKTLYFTPNHLDQDFSNCFTFGPEVSFDLFL